MADAELKLSDITENMEPLKKFTIRLSNAKFDFKYQAVWVLNAFWADFAKPEEIAEDAWTLVQQFTEIYRQESKGNSMVSLDMLGAAKLLEKRGETMTANARRQMLKELDVDGDKKMSLWEYVLHLWSEKKPLKGKDVDWRLRELMNRPQGTNAALEEAKSELADLQAALDDYTAKKAAIDLEIEQSVGKVVKLNRAKNKLAVLNANNLMTDVKFNKKFITAEAKVRSAQKGENKTCQGEVWWSNKVVSEVQKYRAPGRKKN